MFIFCYTELVFEQARWVINMKTLCKAVGVAVLFAASCVFAEETNQLEKTDSPLGGFWVSANVDVYSKYMWRGTILNDRPCWQPSASIGYNTDDFGGIYLNVWSSMDLTHKVNTLGVGNRRHCGMQELDYYIGYTKSFGDLDLEFGHWFYTYPNDNAANYNELYLNLAYNTKVITPGCEIWWQYQDNASYDSAFYFNFYAKHDFKYFEDALTITPKASLGFADSPFVRQYVTDWRGVGADGNGAQITDQTTSLAVSYAITENLTIGANVNYTWVPSATLRSERWMTYGHDSRNQVVWGGVSVALSF